MKFILISYLANCLKQLNAAPGTDPIISEPRTNLNGGSFVADNYKIQFTPNPKIPLSSLEFTNRLRVKWLRPVSLTNIACNYVSHTNTPPVSGCFYFLKISNVTFFLNGDAIVRKTSGLSCDGLIFAKTSVTHCFKFI